MTAPFGHEAVVLSLRQALDLRLREVKGRGIPVGQRDQDAAHGGQVVDDAVGLGAVRLAQRLRQLVPLDQRWVGDGCVAERLLLLDVDFVQPARQHFVRAAQDGLGRAGAVQQAEGMQVRKGRSLMVVTGAVRGDQPRQPAGLGHAHYDWWRAGRRTQQVPLDGQAGTQPQRIVVEADEDQRSTGGRITEAVPASGRRLRRTRASGRSSSRDQVADVRQLGIAHAQRPALPIGL